MSIICDSLSLYIYMYDEGAYHHDYFNMDKVCNSANPTSGVGAYV